jgi:hypothetical protein
MPYLGFGKCFRMELSQLYVPWKFAALKIAGLSSEKNPPKSKIPKLQNTMIYSMRVE